MNADKKEELLDMAIDALRRVTGYLDLIPTSAAVEVREALRLYNEAVKKESERG